MEHDEYVARVKQYLIHCGYEHLMDIEEAAESLWTLAYDEPRHPDRDACEYTIGFDIGLEL